MKSILNGAWRCKGISFSLVNSLLIIAVVVSLAACAKENVPGNEISGNSNSAVASAGDVLIQYTGLSSQTKWELQQARAATAKYLKLENALKDGYVDINVIRPNMGYHYLKPTIVDGTFDPKQPEILVYNKDENDNFHLVAVEYAQPINLPEPSGFTGTADAWTYSTEFNLWLLHAWVWTYNPSGVFNPTNPSVHVH